MQVALELVQQVRHIIAESFHFLFICASHSIHQKYRTTATHQCTLSLTCGKGTRVLEILYIPLSVLSFVSSAVPVHAKIIIAESTEQCTLVQGWKTCGAPFRPAIMAV